jgi:pentafunctional AROM polypeptide
MIDPLDGKSLIGDNTDWLGMRASILKRVGASSLESFDCFGAVIGAGGTARAACFALQSLKMEHLRIWNRTASKSAELVKEFVGFENCQELHQLFQRPEKSLLSLKPRLCILISTIPGSTQDGLDIEKLLEGMTGSKAILVELAYRPLETSFMRQMRVKGEASKSDWSVVPGIEILIEQGYEQFTRWTSQRPPKSIMHETVMTLYNKTQ